MYHFQLKHSFKSIFSRQHSIVNLTFYMVMSSIPKYKIWSPFKELMDEIKEESYGILILNSPINFNFDPEFVLRLWNQARVKITVDGGTEKWIQWLASYKLDSDKVPLPDLITGDMDSVPKDVLNKFRGTSTEIIMTPNQDETDYVKALKEMRKYCTRQNVNVETVYVIADTCGRFDQIIANINALYKSRNILENVKLFQLASTSLTWLLCEGHHEINIPLSLRSNREWCSLIPIGFPCNVTTTGLQWNLDNSKMEFGGMVSTSNTYDGSPSVTIETDYPIIWSMGISSLYSSKKYTDI